MTLTLETALHAIDKHSQVFRIVEHVDDLTDYSVTRTEAEEINEYDPRFKPCVVVTTAREALEAAWELAYETNRIPARTPYIFRAPGIDIQTYKGQPGEMHTGHGMSRLIDPPEPEPWELSTYCYANGHIYERIGGTGTVYWVRPGSEIRYYRDALAKLNPRPVTIEGEKE